MYIFFCYDMTNKDESESVCVDPMGPVGDVVRKATVKLTPNPTVDSSEIPNNQLGCIRDCK